MKLLLIGATGSTGQQLLAQALEQGHEVAVLVRNPEKLREEPHLEVRAGSVMDPAAVESAVHGRDAVLSTLGSRRVGDLFRATLMTTTMRVLVPAMERAGVNRLIVLSAVGVGEAAHQAPALIRIGFRTLLRQIANDKAASEDHVRASGLDWTFVYPPVLTNGPLTKEYRVGEDLRLRGRAQISRADVAHFMLAQLDDPTYSRKNAIISS